MMHPDLAKASAALEVPLPGLEAAARNSEDVLQSFREKLPGILEERANEEGNRAPTDRDKELADVVLLGSIARGESTSISDCDYFVLQHGASPGVSRQLIAAAEQARQEAGYREPGAQGVFANIVIAANLYESIGLDVDSNTNMTRRLLLLTESRSVWGQTRECVIDNILQRYCADYISPSRRASDKARIPRYLLNDLVRFWRTMAVDFGTKRWRTTKGDSYIRLAKLRVTRKILFAGPLATLLMVPHRIQKNEELPDYLGEWLKKPPLSQLASTCEALSIDSKAALRSLLKAYDGFISLLANKTNRNALEKPAEDSSRFEQLRIECKQIGDCVQECLIEIFWNDELFKNNFQEYCVF